MTSFDFTNSQYRFTSPIRYFKANDPIYYEVDNIPLKQLHENDLWLKDQVVGLKSSTEGGVDREGINELRPYVTGSDNVVKVKPGRFTARINDAYSITPLQVIEKVVGTSASDYNIWTAASLSDQGISTVIQSFKQAVAINLNGLVERAFTRPAYIPDYADTRYTSQQAPSITLINGTEQDTGQPPYPMVGAVLWNNFNDSRNSQIPGTAYRITQYDTFQTTIGFSRMGSAETAFIKRWRGVARTAVVDVAEELTIEIPRFNDEDYFYYNEQGVKTYLDQASQRIDLLFIYSKPVDASSTTIAKYVNGAATTITRPQLGIVYGAGLGVNFKQFANRIQEVLDANGINKNFPSTDDSTLPDGTIKMLSHFGDELGQNTGFTISGTTIRGSFPAPDDLMNLSPLLDEDLDSGSVSLIGQSVLPVAYVVVKKAANINSEGAFIISSEDLIDIRPFFRTTELSYNERAGIAAAVPSLSIANPVVTQAELDFELKKVRTDIIGRIPIIPATPTSPANTTPTFQTIYTSGFEDVYFDSPKVLAYGRGLDSYWGLRTNPKDWSVGENIFTRGSRQRFNSYPGEPADLYNSYISDVFILAEGQHWLRDDRSPHSIYMSVVDGAAPGSDQGIFYKACMAGNNHSPNPGGTAGSVNHFTLKVNPITKAPVLPLVFRTFISGDNPETLDINAASPTYSQYSRVVDSGNTLYFTLWITGYRLSKVSRFKGILMD